jgi:hypothetical protein
MTVNYFFGTNNVSKVLPFDEMPEGLRVRIMKSD